jgi:hypothetical protein
MNSLVTIPQPAVQVAVGFYDQAEEQRLQGYPTFDRMRNLVAEGVSVPTAEFLIYYLYHRRRPGKAGFRDYEELGAQIHRALTDLEGFVAFNGSSISTVPDVVSQILGITEHVGESIGLSVVNRIHDLTEADWDTIPRVPGRRGQPSFDYSQMAMPNVGSDGELVVQLEAKGTSVPRSGEHHANVRQQKHRIAEKKSKIRELEEREEYRYPADLRYGTIAVLGMDRDEPVHCWLVDPDPAGRAARAYRVRLLNRMMFLGDWIRFISPRSQFAAALSTRISALMRIAHPRELDGVPLASASGESFEFSPWDPFRQRPCSFFGTKSHVTDGPAGGVVLKLTDRHLLFAGIQQDLVFLAANQEFERILRFSARAGSVEKAVRCVVSDSRFRSMGIQDALGERAQQSGGYWAFILSGQLHYSPEGLVTGVLPLGTTRPD